MFLAGTRSRDREPSYTRRARALAGVVACTMCSVAAPITPTSADDFSDFRIPSNRSLLWNAGLSARAAGNESSGNGADNNSGTSDASVNSQFHWFSDSDPRFTSFDARFFVSGTRDHQDNQLQSSVPPSSSLSSQETSTRDMNEQWSLFGSHRTYPWAAPFGIEIAAGVGGAYAQNWDSETLDQLFANPGFTSQNTQDTGAETWRYQTQFIAAASAGWGRVRDATGIYDAQVLEQRLRETGALTRPLSPEGRRRLAEVMYMRGSFDNVRDRPGRALWQEIERVLAEDGALAEGGLDSYSTLRAAEPHLGSTRALTEDGVPVSPVQRRSGYFVGARLQDTHVNLLSRMDQTSSFETIQNGVVIASGSGSFSNRTSTSFDRVDAGPAGEFHRAIGPAWQLDASGYALLGLRKEDSYLYGDAQASLAWLAADRWSATGFTEYAGADADRTNGATGGDSWQWRIGLGVSWYMEDRTAITLSADENQGWVRGGPGNSHFFHRSLDATIAVTYRFSGWFAAPGFFPVAASSVAPPRP